MNNFVILNIQALMGLTAYFLVYWNFLRPWLQTQTFERAVLPLLVLNIFRFLGLTFLVTGQLDSSLSRDALELIAYGDFAASICALLAALALTTGSRLATPLVALYSVVGIADLMMVFPTALGRACSRCRWARCGSRSGSSRRSSCSATSTSRTG